MALLRASWIFGSVVALAIVVGVLQSRVKRQRRSRGSAGPDREEPPELPPLKPKRRWQDEIGATLDRANIEAGVLSVPMVRALEWKRFEILVARIYAQDGVRAEIAGKGPDGGIDVRLVRAGASTPFCFIQCKAWDSERIPITQIRQFLGVMAAGKVNAGIFATTSEFWPDARTFARANGIEPVTADDLVQRFNALPPATRSEILAEAMAGDYTTPTCPTCDVKAVPRARKADGVKFWACRRCRWTMTARAG